MASKINENEAIVIVNEMYDSVKPLVQEFIKDGELTNFKEIKQVTWFNLISSLAAVVMRIDSIKNDEKLMEAVLYQLILKIIKNELPINEETKSLVLNSFKLIGPKTIDFIIPNPNAGCGKCHLF